MFVGSFVFFPKPREKGAKRQKVVQGLVRKELLAEMRAVKEGRPGFLEAESEYLVAILKKWRQKKYFPGVAHAVADLELASSMSEALGLELQGEDQSRCLVKEMFAT